MVINKTWFIILILLGIVGGIFLIYPHLADNIWQDEAYTLIKFSTSGPFYPFTNYHVPNNHPLFSSLMSLWWGWGDSIVHLRLLPFLIFIFVLALFAYTAKRLGGPVAAIFATIMFATSQVTENFALQIRGYSLSWLPVTACLLALPHYIEHGHKKWIILFIISSAVCIAIIPSNMFICLAFVLWGFSLIFLNKKLYIRQKLLQVLLILLGPLLGMVSYSLIWNEVIKESQKKWSMWNYSEIIQHWTWATISDFMLLIPFILFGALLLFKGALTDKSLSIGSPRNQLLLLSSLIISFLFWMIISPNPPFPRTFVPFLPVWYFCI